MSGSEDDRDDFGAPDDRLLHGKVGPSSSRTRVAPLPGFGNHRGGGVSRSSVMSTLGARVARRLRLATGS